MKGLVSAVRGVLSHSARSVGHRCFGVALKDFYAAHGYLPPVIGDCVKYLLQEEHLEREGLFRVPGSGEQLRLLKSAYDQGQIPDLSQQEVFTVCSLLSLYLRELPASVLPCETCETLKERPEDVPWIQACVGSMHVAHRLACNLIFKLAHQMTLHQESNKMSASNLAICLTLDLVHEEGADAIAALASSGRYGSTVACLIANYHEIFKRVEEERLKLIEARSALSSQIEEEERKKQQQQDEEQYHPEARATKPLTIWGQRSKSPCTSPRPSVSVSPRVGQGRQKK